MEYYTNRHSCYLLQYHLVLLTKYRHPVIVNELENYLKDYINNYFEKQECSIIELETNLDHIHILFESSPNIKLSDFINTFKSASSRVVRNKFKKELEHYYWKPYFWSNSYFVATVSENSTKIVAKYIENQK